jgi:hypothetical protein
MDREQVKTVQNQKVFVPLSAVMEVQADLLRSVASANLSDNAHATTRNYARGMAQVIKSLGLPIEIPNGY